MTSRFLKQGNVCFNGKPIGKEQDSTPKAMKSKYTGNIVQIRRRQKSNNFGFGFLALGSLSDILLIRIADIILPEELVPLSHIYLPHGPQNGRDL